MIFSETLSRHLKNLALANVVYWIIFPVILLRQMKQLNAAMDGE
jgi:hypothetical protein